MLGSWCQSWSLVWSEWTNLQSWLDTWWIYYSRGKKWLVALLCELCEQTAVDCCRITCWCWSQFLWGKSCLKLFIVSCMFASIVVFAKHVHFISVSMFYATDKKSEVAFQCLIHLLPSPPRKRVKVPQLFPELLLRQFFAGHGGWYLCFHF